MPTFESIGSFVLEYDKTVFPNNFRMHLDHGRTNTNMYFPQGKPFYMNLKDGKEYICEYSVNCKKNTVYVSPYSGGGQGQIVRLYYESTPIISSITIDLESPYKDDELQIIQMILSASYLAKGTQIIKDDKIIIATITKIGSTDANPNAETEKTTFTFDETVKVNIEVNYI